MVARLLDLACLAAIAVLTLPLSREWGTFGLAAQAGILVLGAAIVALLGLRQGVPSVLPAPVRRRAEVARAALRAIPLSRICLALPIVGASWVLEAAVLIGAADLLGIDLSWQVAVGVTAFTILFQVIHITPGGLGVYEAAMTSALVSQGVDPQAALGLAVLTHAMKFGYAFTAGALFASGEAVSLLRGRPAAPRGASRFEVVMARLWNVVNEGKPFTVLFSLSVAVLLTVTNGISLAVWANAAIALVAVAPLAWVFWRFDFPMRLRAALWVYLAVYVALTQSFAARAASRWWWGCTSDSRSSSGGPCTTTCGSGRDGRMDSASSAWSPRTRTRRAATCWSSSPRSCSSSWCSRRSRPIRARATLGPVALLTAVIAVVGAVAAPVVLHVGAGTPPAAHHLGRSGRRRDRRAPRPRPARAASSATGDRDRDRRLPGRPAREARTPFLDRLRANGTEYLAMDTVYPARTVTCFTSMLTGAAPETHGMRSNFVPSLGVKCESLFDVLRRDGMTGRLVGIAHLIDAFGDEDVRSVTAVMHNDEIDDALIAQAQRTLLEDDPELLVLQLLSVDQTGHARGSYNDEYLAKIEETDTKIEAFLGVVPRARLPRRGDGARHRRPRPGHRHRRARPHGPDRGTHPLHPVGRGRRGRSCLRRGRASSPTSPRRSATSWASPRRASRSGGR